MGPRRLPESSPPPATPDEALRGVGAELAEMMRVQANSLRQLQDDLRAEFAPNKAAPRLMDFADRWLAEYAKANRQKPRGIDSKESHLRVHWLPRLGERPLNQIKDEDIQRFKADMAAKKPKTVNNILCTLNKLLKTAVKWRVLSRMPVQIELLRAELPRVSFYEFDEYAQLVSVAELMDPRELVTVLLGGDAGLRLAEMIGLKWQDIDWRREQLHVARAISQGETTMPKGDRTRYVPLTSKLLNALNALHLTRCGEYVLTRDDGSVTSEQTLRTWISRVQRATALPDSGALHILRHTFCSHLAMRGAPVIAIQKLAGHQSLRTTMRYMHLADSEARRAVELLNAPRQPDGMRRASGQNDLSPTGFEPVVGKKRGNRKKKRSPDGIPATKETRRGALSKPRRRPASEGDGKWGPKKD